MKISPPAPASVFWQEPIPQRRSPGGVGGGFTVPHVTPQGIGSTGAAASIATHQVTLDVTFSLNRVTVATAFMAVVPGPSMFILGDRLSQSNEILLGYRTALEL